MSDPIDPPDDPQVFVPMPIEGTVGTPTGPQNVVQPRLTRKPGYASPASPDVSLDVQVAQAMGLPPVLPETPRVLAPELDPDAEIPVDPYATLDPTAPLGLRYTRRNLVVPGLPPRDLTVQEVCDLVRCQDDGGPIRGGLNGLLHPYSGAYEATPDTPTLPTWEALTQGQPQAG